MSLTTVTGSMITPSTTLSGDVTVTGTMVMSSSFMRNRIINGAMQVWQRGTSFTPTAGTPVYVVDRFCSYQSNTSPTVSQSTDVPTGQGFKYSLKTQRPAANTGTAAQYVAQAIESVNMLDLAGQTITFSFWAKAGANYSQTYNNLSVIVSTGTVADQGTTALFAGSITGVANVISTTVVLTTTWTKYSLSGSVGSSALEMFAYFAETPTGTAGADDSFYITGVQLEIGTSATPFERRLYNQELANCQRYYYRIAANASYGTNRYGPIFIPNSTTASGLVQFPVTMRTFPTGSYSALSDWTVTTSTQFSITAMSINTVPYNGEIDFTISGATAGQGGQIRSNTTSAWIDFSAEL